MKRRILLHIGSPKCGSTYLQRALLQNRDRLAAHGIRYPHDGGEHPGNAAQPFTMSTPPTLAGPARARSGWKPSSQPRTKCC